MHWLGVPQHAAARHACNCVGSELRAQVQGGGGQVAGPAVDLTVVIVWSAQAAEFVRQWSTAASRVHLNLSASCTHRHYHAGLGSCVATAMLLASGHSP